MRKVQITVLKCDFDPALADAYLTEGRDVGPCPLLTVGQVFVYQGGAVMPDDFCPWAWVDIYRGVSTLSAGGSTVPWTNREGMQVYCCTDGIRPVTFLLEALPDTGEAVD